MVVLAGGGADNGDEQNPAPKTENGTKLSLTDIKDIVLIISSLVTIFIAFTSLQKWQLELKGKVLYDYARVFLINLYTIRDTFKYIRNAFIGVNEFDPNYKVSPGKKGY